MALFLSGMPPFGACENTSYRRVLSMPFGALPVNFCFTAAPNTSASVVVIFPSAGVAAEVFWWVFIGIERGWELSGLVARFALQLGLRKLRAVGGEGEIRTPESLAALALFESARINHSRTSPY